jgi:hypothetical protein
VNALAAGAPPGVQASLEAMRHALVKEAIDFSEAVQAAAPSEALAPEPGERARPARARVLSNAAAPQEVPAPRRQRALSAVLAAAVVAAAAFHGHRWYGRVAASARPTIAGAPAGAFATQPDAPGVPNVPKVLARTGGEAFDPAEVKTFAADEARKGNTVQEIAPGLMMVVPGRVEPPPAAPPAGASAP